MRNGGWIRRASEAAYSNDIGSDTRNYIEHEVQHLYSPHKKMERVSRNGCHMVDHCNLGDHDVEHVDLCYVYRMAQ